MTKKGRPMIYHMLPAEEWQRLNPREPYAAATLETEGFIHCTQELDRLLWVANRFYRQLPGDFLLLEIDPTRLQAELRWEEADGYLFPHIYGPVNRDAICQVLPFPRNNDGEFTAPAI
ncbi:MAG: DUF952 domain-containing protein [Caldilineaceae bacterium]|nr:DUF952 domain-containing protein [Caldilineaceae bacterium]